MCVKTILAYVFIDFYINDDIECHYHVHRKQMLQNFLSTSLH